MSHMPGYVWALAISAAIGIPGLAALMLSRGASQPGEGRRIATVAAAVIATWIAVSAALAATGAYQHGTRQAAPWFAVAFGAGLAGALLASRLPSVRRILDTPSVASRLVLPHTLRVEGIVFLLLLAQHQLPAVFALPAGIGDIVTGLSAPFVARRLARGTRTPGVIWFTLFGVADLVAALSIGFLAGLGPVRVFHGAASTLPLSQLPLALIPTVAVPAAIALHIVTYAQLRQRAPACRQRLEAASTAGPAPA